PKTQRQSVMMKWWKADSISNESILAGMKMANNG
ncbi:hypothetical protein ECP03019043_5091, partial [Escherichia coli P0301904.3]